MRLLFTSDLHEFQFAFERFAGLLASGRYDLGVLGGDLVDEWHPDEEVMRLLGVEADDLLDELTPEGEDPVEAWRRSRPHELQVRAREARVRELTSIVESAGVPIVLVHGNHDLSTWAETGLITDIHMKRVVRAGWAFAGYRWTTMDRPPVERRRDMRSLRRMVDRRTILVTHSPTLGTLDGAGPDERGYGLPELRSLRRRPWLHLVGHVHSAAGVDGRTVNGAWPSVRRFFEIDVESQSVVTVE